MAHMRDMPYMIYGLGFRILDVACYMILIWHDLHIYICHDMT